MTANKEDPRIVRSRALILDAAREVFLESGYQAATTDRIAEKAGIAKRTIYNLYSDKESLFRATIFSAIEVADAFAASLAEEVRLTEASVADLIDIGRRLAETTLLGLPLSLRRLLVMESHRFPDLVTEYRSRAPEAVMAALADLLESMMRAGSLRPASPQLAAQHFAFLVMGADLDRAMFTGIRPSARGARLRAIAGAEAFARAYVSPDRACNSFSSGPG
ncbi:MAG: TetR/AcrR family transcriptional regulator [Micropruina sp.]|uniref:TetR/AcrR family transcriptional regulator n=1 Tax=Micropruina sp. TaxID=2737536 RepID=UPI0039E503AC